MQQALAMFGGGGEKVAGVFKKKEKRAFSRGVVNVHKVFPVS